MRDLGHDDGEVAREGDCEDPPWWARSTNPSLCWKDSNQTCGKFGGITVLQQFSPVSILQESQCKWLPVMIWGKTASALRLELLPLILKKKKGKTEGRILPIPALWKKKSKSSWCYQKLWSFYSVWMTRELGRRRDELWFVVVNLLGIETRFHTCGETGRSESLWNSIFGCVSGLSMGNSWSINRQQKGSGNGKITALLHWSCRWIIISGNPEDLVKLWE